LTNHFVPVAAGLVVGILISLTGMGGGAIMTPFLILVMKIDPVLAVGTDLVFAAVTKWTSGLHHHRQDNVGLRMVFWMALGSVPASLLVSTYVVAHLDEKNGSLQHLLARLLGVVLVLVSVYTLARILNWVHVPKDERWPPAWALTLLGALGGGLVGMTSVGSGTVIMASLMLFFSIPPAQMVGLDVMHGALLTTVPAGVYTFAGQVDWSLIAWLLVGSIPGAWLGARLVTIVPQRLVRGALSLLLILAGLQLFLD
jgi:uncharacterized membrane protein YfcA